jgi:hypothetical protein
LPNPADSAERVDLIRTGIKELIATLDAGGARTIALIADATKQDGGDPRCLAKSPFILSTTCQVAPSIPLDSEARPYSPEINAAIRAAASDAVVTVIPQDGQADGCKTIVDGEFIYRDDHHLRLNLSAQTRMDLVKMFHFREALAQAIENMDGSGQLADHIRRGESLA